MEYTHKILAEAVRKDFPGASVIGTKIVWDREISPEELEVACIAAEKRLLGRDCAQDILQNIQTERANLQYKADLESALETCQDENGIEWINEQLNKL